MQINKNVVEGILGHLEQVIESVEKLRGVKRDEKLRYTHFFFVYYKFHLFVSIIYLFLEKNFQC